MPRRLRPYLYCLLTFLLLTALIQLAMGRIPISKSHRILLWVGDKNSPEQSQQLFDWYSFSHLIHGFIFYAVLHLLTRRRPWPIPPRFALALLIECVWEIIENTPFTIDRYRAATISLDYYGDSILNSASDICCCALGFALARRLPVWAPILITIFLELLCAYVIRDNLTLNVLMLLCPLDSVKHWQAGHA